MTDRMDSRYHTGEGRVPGVVIAVALCCLVPEVILSGAEWGLWGTPHWRSLAMGYGAFWPGLLGNWTPNYPFQAETMFLSYGFLHAGLAHLAVNLMTLMSLGPVVAERAGTAGFLRIYGLSLLGGSLAYALLSSTPAPMVGASGALFGLAGAILSWEYRDRSDLRESLRPVLAAIAALVGLNLVLWWAMNGHLAWQAHLGGFVSGWLAASARRKRTV